MTLARNGRLTVNSSSLCWLAMLLLISLTCLSCTQEKCVPDVPPSVLERPAMPALMLSAARDTAAPCPLVVSLSEPVLVDRGLWFVITVSAQDSEPAVTQHMGTIQDHINAGWLGDGDIPFLVLVDRHGSRVRYQIPYKPCAAYKPKDAGWFPVPFPYFDRRDWRDPIRTTKTTDGWTHVQSRVSIRFMDRTAEPPNMAALNPAAPWSELVKLPNVCVAGDLRPVIEWSSEPSAQR